MKIKPTTRARRMLFGAYLAFACPLVAVLPGFAANGPLEAVERLRVQIPALDRVDASASYVSRTVQGEKTGYIVIFKTGSIADPTAKGRAERATRTKTSSVVDMPIEAAKLKVLTEAGVRRADARERYSQLPLTYVEVSSAAELNSLLAHTEISSLHENREHWTHASPYTSSSNLDLVKLPSVQAFGTLGAGTVVAVLDTGLRYKVDTAGDDQNATVEAFGNCPTPGASGCRVLIAEEAATLSPDGNLDAAGLHGTNVAGVIAALAPGVKLIAIDVFNGLSAFSNDIIAGMNRVIELKNMPGGPNIVAMNLSIGDGNPTTGNIATGPYYSPVQIALSAGIATIVSSGNNGFTNGITAPANTVGAISVGAVFSEQPATPPMPLPANMMCYGSSAMIVDKVVCNSNSANFLTILAPGSPIKAVNVTQEGTSQAAPHVAAAYAILRSSFPNESHDAIVTRLKSQSVPITDTRNNISFPRLDLWRAMGSCTYSGIPASIQLLSPAASRTFSIRASNAVCPVGHLNANPEGFISATTVNRDLSDPLLWHLTFSVSSHPGGSMPRAATFKLNLAADAVPVNIPVTQSHTAGQQDIQLSLNGINFGEQATSGFPSRPVSVEIKNSGTINPLLVSNICSVTESATSCAAGPVCPQYSATTNCVGVEIAPQAVCGTNVTFTPTSLGEVRCNLRVESNASSGTKSIGLVGNGNEATGGKFSNLSWTDGKLALSTGDNLADIQLNQSEKLFATGNNGNDYLLLKYNLGPDAMSQEYRFARSAASPGTSRGLFVRSFDPYVLIFGNYSNGSEKKVFVARANANTGALDAAFPSGPSNPGGFNAPADSGGGWRLQAAAIDASGRMYLKINCAMVRLNANGSQDVSYGGAPGFVQLDGCDATDLDNPANAGAIHALADGTVLYATSSVFPFPPPTPTERGMGIGKLDANGSKVLSFGKSGLANGRIVPGAARGYASDLALLADGRILAVGPIWPTYADGNSAFSAHVVRFTANGEIDTSFGQGGSIALSTLSDGTRFYPGAIRALGTGQFAVLRKPPPSPLQDTGAGTYSIRFHKADGTLDGSFQGRADPALTGAGGILNSTQGNGAGLALASDGGPIVAFNASPSGFGAFTPPTLTGSNVEGVVVRVVGQQSTNTTITNPLSEVVTVTSMTVSNNDFAVNFSACGTITANGNCSVAITPASGVAGFREATLVVNGTNAMAQVISFVVVLRAVVSDTAVNQLLIKKIGNGLGRVQSVPSGIDCGETCAVSISAGASMAARTLTLSAFPALNSEFDGWSGPCSGTGPCSVTVSAATEVTANFRIKFSAIPLNDAFASRRVLSGSLVPAAGAPLEKMSSIGASKESGEPNHAGNSGGRSLWWTWTAPSAGPVTIDTNGSSFDTLLAVYTGTAVNSLTLVASTDDGGDFFRSKVTFDAKRGQTYQISVDGFNGAMGEVVVNLHQPVYFYMTGLNAQMVYAFDTVKNQFAPSNISNPYYMNGQVAINSTGDRLYVPNYHAGHLSVFDPRSQTQVAIPPITTGGGAESVAVNPLGNRVYVANYLGESVSVIDAVANSKVNAMSDIPDIPIGESVSQVVVHPSGNRVYVTSQSGNRVGVIDASNNKLVARINIGQNAYGIVFDPTGAHAYVSSTNGVISIIDTQNNTVVSEIKARMGNSNDLASPNGFAIDPAGTRLYTTNVNSNSVSVIDIGSRSILKTFLIGVQGIGLAVSLDGRRIITTNRNANSVFVFDPDACLDGVICTPLFSFAGVTGAWSVNGGMYSGGLPVPGVPTNDLLASAFQLAGAYATTIADNSLASANEPNETSLGAGTSGKTLWWTWTAPRTAPAIIDTFGSHVDTIVRVHTGNVFPLTAVGGATTEIISPANSPVTTKLRFNAVAGTTYRIAVDSKNGAPPYGGPGRLTLTVWQPLRAYFTNYTNATVTQFDTVTNTVLKVWKSGMLTGEPDGQGPHGVAVSPDGTRIFTTNYGSGTVAVFNRDDTGDRPFQVIPVGQYPYSITMSPNGNRVLVGSGGSANLTLIDASTLQTTSIPLGKKSVGVAFAFNDSDTAYAANFHDNENTVSRIRFSGGAPVVNSAWATSVATPYAIATKPDGTVLVTSYVPSMNRLIVIPLTPNGDASASRDSLVVGEGTEGVAASPSGSHVAVTSRGPNEVRIFNGTPGAGNVCGDPASKGVTVSGQVEGVSFTPSGDYMYTANYTGNSISAIRLSDCKLVGTYGGFSAPISMGIFIEGAFTSGSVPTAPTNVSVAPGNGQLTVNFTPGVPNGTVTTQFSAVATAGGNSITATCTAPCTSIVIMGLTNSTQYSVVVYANSATGNSLGSTPVVGTPIGGSGLTLTTVVSRKTHGTAGDFNVLIDPTKLISGAVDVEPRNIGTGHRIIFTFSQPVTSIGTVTALDAMNLAVGSVASSFSGNTVTVLLTNVPNGKRVTVSIPNVNGSGNGSASLGFLVGDVNSTGIVTAADIAGIKARSGQATVLTNAKYDINLSGNIEATDVSAVKVRAGNRLQ